MIRRPPRSPLFPYPPLSRPPPKMTPPLREAADVAALRQALKEGVIDCIASDHAPHAYDAKEAAFDDAPFGIVGLETAFAVAHTELVAGGMLTLPELILRMSKIGRAHV